MSKGIERYHRPMDCPPAFWLNHTVYWIRLEAAYMSEKKTTNVTGVSHVVGLKEIRHVAYAALQHVIAVGVLVFYSKNAIGAALRAFIGA